MYHKCWYEFSCNLASFKFLETTSRKKRLEQIVAQQFLHLNLHLLLDFLRPCRIYRKQLLFQFIYLVAHIWSSLLHLVCAWWRTVLIEGRMRTCQRQNKLLKIQKLCGNNVFLLGCVAGLGYDAQSTSLMSTPMHSPPCHTDQSHWQERTSPVGCGGKKMYDCRF